MREDVNVVANNSMIQLPRTADERIAGNYSGADASNELSCGPEIPDSPTQLQTLRLPESSY